jgi:hypothetical protein
MKTSLTSRELQEDGPWSFPLRPVDKREQISPIGSRWRKYQNIE